MTTSQPPRNESFGVRLNRWTLSLSRRWLRVLLVFIGLYATLPFLAPTFMHFGLTGPAQFLYTVYSPTCHQFAFRSWFLFGEQPAYPRASVDFPGLVPYESHLDEIDSAVPAPQGYPENSEISLELRSRSFIGNTTMGYKVAICERDVAIYLSLFVGGLIYSIPTVRKHLRGVPWWLYLLLGILPIAIDGFSQYLSYPIFPGMHTGLWPLRETTPIFRTVTGALFGLMNAWLAFPYLERSARDVGSEISEKFDTREERKQTEREQIRDMLIKKKE